MMQDGSSGGAIQANPVDPGSTEQTISPKYESTPKNNISNRGHITTDLKSSKQSPSALDNTMIRDMKEFSKSKLKSGLRGKNRISRQKTIKILEEKTVDNRGWFSRAMYKIAGVDYEGY